MPLIIDCDPGVDDAVALLLAFASPELEVLAVTTVAGNVPGHRTQRNARMIRQIAGREDVPVYGGAERPLKRPPAHAGEFHGPEGLGDLQPFEPAGIIGDGPAANAIVDLVMKRPAGEVSIAMMGPMTNLALAMKRERRLAERLGTVVVMGGARSEGGNITASAEFNADIYSEFNDFQFSAPEKDKRKQPARPGYYGRFLGRTFLTGRTGAPSTSLLLVGHFCAFSTRLT